MTAVDHNAVLMGSPAVTGTLILGTALSCTLHTHEEADISVILTAWETRAFDFLCTEDGFELPLLLLLLPECWGYRYGPPCLVY